MANPVVSYDGGVAASPEQLVSPETVADIQAILRDTKRFPGPVRPKGSFHSLTPCAASEGTMIDMRGMKEIIDVDPLRRTFTAQGGLQLIDAANALRLQELQLYTNAEIGNITLGSAACCQTKDGLDGVEYGQMSSYVTGMKWVTPAGDLAEVTEESDPELLRKMRSSYGLCGVIYEVTFKIKPLETLHFTYEPRPVDELTQEEVEEKLETSEGMIMWTIGKTVVFQRRTKVAHTGILSSIQAAARDTLWNRAEAHFASFIDRFVTNKSLRDEVQGGFFEINHLLFSALHALGGITMPAPDKIIDYRKTKESDRYAFTFWGFPRKKWLTLMREYLEFAEAHFRGTGFRCNMPLGSYHIPKDQKAILSYSHDGDIVSIDPIHAPTDDDAWHFFVREFNDWAYARGGTPLLNQSPFVERKHVEQAFGQRWFEYSEWVKSMDPTGRLLNPFFAELLSARPATT